MAGNSALSAAVKAKKDEFYTQLTDIEKEMRYYRKHFKDKTVLCNCDDPFEFLDCQVKCNRVSKKTSKGDSQLRHLRGRRLIFATMSASRASETSSKDVSFGKYCRSKPLVFSLVPRCHGE